MIVMLVLLSPTEAHPDKQVVKKSKVGVYVNIFFITSSSGYSILKNAKTHTFRVGTYDVASIIIIVQIQGTVPFYM